MRRPFASRTVIAKCDVGRDLDPHGAVRLDRRVAEHLAHPELRCDAERAVAEVEGVAVGQAHGLFDAQEPRGALRRGRQLRVGDRGDAARGHVDAVDVVHAADVEDADALGFELRVEIDAGRSIEEHRRQHARLQRDDVRKDDAFPGVGHGHLRALLRVVDPQAIQRRSRDGGGGRQPLVGAGHDPRAIEQTALRPADEDAPAAVEQRKRRIEASARRRSFHRPDDVDGRRFLRRAGEHTGVRLGRLHDVDEVAGVDLEQVATFVGRFERLHAHQQVAVRHRPRLEELDRRVVGAGRHGCARRRAIRDRCRPAGSCRGSFRRGPGAWSQRVKTMRPSSRTDGSRSWLWLNEIWWMLLPSAFMTCSTNAGPSRFSSWASNCGLPSSSRIAFDCRWRVEVKTMRPSGR